MVVTAGVALSATVNVNVVFCMADFGVPVIVPVALSSARSGGKSGFTDHAREGATVRLADRDFFDFRFN